jgi:hypothetical protein
VKIDELRRAKNQRPFQPFQIVMADSQEPIRINHPDAIAWGDQDNPRVAVVVSRDGYQWLEVALITRIMGEAPAGSVDSNGAGGGG